MSQKQQTNWSLKTTQCKKLNQETVTSYWLRVTSFRVILWGNPRDRPEKLETRNA